MLACLPLFVIMVDYNEEDMAMTAVYIVTSAIILTTIIEGTSTICKIKEKCSRKKIGPDSTLDKDDKTKEKPITSGGNQEAGGGGFKRDPTYVRAVLYRDKKISGAEF